MKSRPILFSGAMVRAIMSGTKTQTRRICGHADMSRGLARSPWVWSDAVYPARERGWIAWQGAMQPGPELEVETKRLYREGFMCPHGEPGDSLWVRETWAVRKLQAGYWVEYKADGSNARVTHEDAPRLALPADSWRPSIFMPRWACRLEVQIVGIRVERLQDISEADAQSEGVASVAEYAALWDSLNAKRGYGWAVNPWVWVVEFQR
jgi:hypothetical protein